MAHKKGVLTVGQMSELKVLGKKIQQSLACDATSTGPCRTDRLAAVRGMTRYLRIHGFRVEQLLPIKMKKPRAKTAV
jgi:hypothetical protein